MQDDIVQCRELLAKKVVGDLEFSNAAGPSLIDTAAAAAVPTLLPDKADPNTGIGKGAADALSIVAGGVEAVRFSEAAAGVIQSVKAQVGLTADAGSAQGNGVIISSYNVYDTVGTAGDAATLPAAFTAGTLIYIKNGAAANSMDVFPASGDDLGAGANTQRALAAKDFVVYIATTANATWEEIMRGTCSA